MKTITLLKILLILALINTATQLTLLRSSPNNVFTVRGGSTHLASNGLHNEYRTSNLNTITKSELNPHKNSHSRHHILLRRLQMRIRGGSTPPPPPLSPTSSIPKGLRNEGNTCYLNSVLQCFFSIPEVRDSYIHGDDDDCSGDDSHSNGDDNCPLKEIATTLITKPHTTSAAGTASVSATVANARDLINRLNINPDVQQDSHEFVRVALFPLLKKSVRELFGFRTSNVITTTTDDGDGDGDGEKKVKNVKCGVYYDLTLPINSNSEPNNDNKNKNKNTIENLIKNRFNPTILTATKTITETLTSTPEVLMVHLNRFTISGSGDSAMKVCDNIAFEPNLTLNVDGDGGVRYKLQSCVIHVGSGIESGHYYAYIRKGDNRWFRVDDDRVTNVKFNDVGLDGYGRSESGRNKKKGWFEWLSGENEGEVGYGGKSACAYLLFYVKVDGSDGSDDCDYGGSDNDNDAADDNEIENGDSNASVVVVDDDDDEKGERLGDL